MTIMTPPPRLIYRDPETQRCWYHGEGGSAHWVTDPADDPTTVLAALVDPVRDWPLRARELPMILRIPGPHGRGRHRLDRRSPDSILWYLAGGGAVLAIFAAVSVAATVAGW